MEPGAAARGRGCDADRAPAPVRAGVALEKVYAADRAIVTKRNERGAAISSVSAPSLQATMLAQLQVAPGQRVLEIGSGGYNTALLRELVGPDGSVTTLDIDQEIADRARPGPRRSGSSPEWLRCASAPPPPSGGVSSIAP